MISLFQWGGMRPCGLGHDQPGGSGALEHSHWFKIRLHGLLADENPM